MTLHVPFFLQWSQLLYPSLTLFFLFIFTLLCMLRLNTTWSKKQNLPPSPPKLPIIGNLHQLGSLVHRSFRDLSNKYGSVMFLQMGSEPTIVVSSAEMARKFLKTHDVAFSNRFVTSAAKLILYQCTDVVFAPYGEYWKKAKKICATELLSVSRVQSFKTVREEEVHIMNQEISQSCSVGAEINVSDLFLKVSNNIICTCSFGSKHAGKDGKREMGELARDLLGVFDTFTFGSLIPWLGWIDKLTGLVGRMKTLSAELDTYFERVIDERLTQSVSRYDAPDYRKDFLDILLEVQETNKFTRDNIKAIILDMFVGASDTTSTILEWAMSELIKNQNIMKKAQEEVRRVVGKKSKVEEDDINQMDYLKYIVKETLRLHPPGVFLPRASSSTESTNVKGYHVPPNTKVLINVWTIQRDPKVWDRPEEFIPERFIDNTTEYKGQHFEFIPFGSGRRMCPGSSFGIAVVEFVLANLLYWYDWKLPGGAHVDELDMTENIGFSSNRKNHLHLVPMIHFS